MTTVDPFTQKEFYQFFATFNNVPEFARGPHQHAAQDQGADAEQQAELKKLATRFRASAGRQTRANAIGGRNAVVEVSG